MHRRRMAVIEASCRISGVPILDLEGLVLLAWARDAAGLEHLLRPWGVTVLPAHSAQEVLDGLRLERPDAIACDLDGYADGLFLVRRMRMRSRLEGGATPAIAISSSPSPQAHTRALLAGFQAFVQPEALSLALSQVTGDLRRSLAN
jgi:CheY-like chemotaxis protein